MAGDQRDPSMLPRSVLAGFAAGGLAIMVIGMAVVSAAALFEGRGLVEAMGEAGRFIAPAAVAAGLLAWSLRGAPRACNATDDKVGRA